MNRNPGGRRALGLVLRELREARGLTQEALAHAAGFDRTYVGQIERAEKSPTFEMLWRVLAALGVTWTEFGQVLDASPAIRRGPDAGVEGPRRPGARTPVATVPRVRPASGPRAAAPSAPHPTPTQAPTARAEAEGDRGKA